MEEMWRIKNRKQCAAQAKDMFAQLKELVLDGINQFRRKQEANISGRKKKMKSTRRTSDASLNNVEGTMPGVMLCSHPGESSPWLGLHLGPGL